jgi:hypothetical protein
MISIRRLVCGRLARAIVTLTGSSGNKTSMSTQPNASVTSSASPNDRLKLSKRTTITIEQERFVVVRGRRDLEQK